MKRPKQGTCSTRRRPSQLQVDCNVVPPDEPTANNIFCFAALADKQTGTLYTDATGALPVGIHLRCNSRQSLRCLLLLLLLLRCPMNQALPTALLVLSSVDSSSSNLESTGNDSCDFRPCSSHRHFPRTAPSSSFRTASRPPPVASVPMHSAARSGGPPPARVSSPRAHDRVSITPPPCHFPLASSLEDGCCCLASIVEKGGFFLAPAPVSGRYDRPLKSKTPSHCIPMAGVSTSLPPAPKDCLLFFHLESQDRILHPPF